MAGPEGGLSAAEETAAIAGGWTPLKLGPRILRTETAALAAAAAMQTVWGDYGA
jgi:16S rRNA (uracil1498-N3)-methyltransferase